MSTEAFFQDWNVCGYVEGGKELFESFYKWGCREGNASLYEKGSVAAGSPKVGVIMSGSVCAIVPEVQMD